MSPNWPLVTGGVESKQGFPDTETKMKDSISLLPNDRLREQDATGKA